MFSVTVEDRKNFRYTASRSDEEVFEASLKEPEVELKTENGAVLLLPDCAVANGKMLAIDESRTYFGKCDYGRGHNSLIADFYSCVSRGEKFWINGEEGAKVVKLILAVYESNGKEVKIGEA